MPISILKSKLYPPPRRAGVVARPQLIERLNAGWNCKLTLISAPAGFGKTTLAADWIASSGRPFAWVQLDKGDNDPARFLAYFIAGLQQIRHGTAASVLPVLEAGSPGSAFVPSEAVLGSLVNAAAEIEQPFVIVLDDYHTISEQSIQDALNFILDHKPPHMHLLISSRADPPWQLARMRAFGDVNELRTGDLRFTPLEAATFLNEMMKLSLPVEAVAALEERTEGWIAGLQMAALAMQGRGDVAGFIKAFTGSNRFISDFLLEEVLARQAEAVQEFLLRTSILERVCAPLAAALMSEPGGSVTTVDGALLDSQNNLEMLDRSNLFLTPLDDERFWYRYHYLFQDLLRSSLESTHPGLAPRLHRRASQWLAEVRLYEDAVTHALASTDFEWAGGLVEQAVAQMEAENKMLLIARWIDTLPQEVAQSRPWLCVYRAWGFFWTGRRMGGEVEASLRSAEAAVEQGLARTRSGQPGALSEMEARHIQGHIAGIRAHHALNQEDIPRVLEQGQKALELLPIGDEMRCETGVALGGAYWALGDVRQSEEAFARGRKDALLGHSPTKAVSAGCYEAMQQTKQGRLDDALVTYREALHLATASDGSESYMAGFPNAKLGDLLRERNELDHAKRHLEKAIKQCAQLGQADVRADSFVCLANYQIACGEVAAAQQNLAQADEITTWTKVDPFVVCWMDDCRLRLWLAQGDLAAAARWAERSGLQADGELSYHYDLHHLNLARVLVARGTQEASQPILQEALGLLDRILAAAQKAGWVHEQIKILLLQALARQACKARPEALAALTRALQLAHPGKYIRIFVDEGEPLRLLLEECRKSPAKQPPTLTSYIEQLLAAFAAGKAGIPVVNPPVRAATRLAEPLTERELEVLRLLQTSMTSTEIAAQLYLSSHTVRTHIKNIYSKLDAGRRMEAVQKARDLGLL